MKANYKSTKGYKTIYSLRIRQELMKMGFEPILEKDNIYKNGFKCWVYENSEDFQMALGEVFERRGQE